MKKEPLCHSCSWFSRVVFTDGSEHRTCGQFHKLKIKNLATHCTDYSKKDEPSLKDMKAMAWILTQSSQAGYIKPDLTFQKKKEEEPVDRNQYKPEKDNLFG